MTTQPHGVVVVARYFVVREQQILALRRSTNCQTNAGLWETPGGQLKGNENPEATGVREGFEETGLHLIPVPSIWHTEADSLTRVGKYRGMTRLTLFGIATIESTQIELSAEHTAFSWCSLSELLSLNLTDLTRKATEALHPLLRHHL